MGMSSYSYISDNIYSLKLYRLTQWLCNIYEIVCHVSSQLIKNHYTSICIHRYIRDFFRYCILRVDFAYIAVKKWILVLLAMSSQCSYICRYAHESSTACNHSHACVFIYFNRAFPVKNEVGGEILYAKWPLSDRLPLSSSDGYGVPSGYATMEKIQLWVSITGDW